MHEATVQTTVEDIAQLRQRFLPNKSRQALDGQLDVSGTVTFAEKYLFNGYRLEAIERPQARAALQMLIQAQHAAIQRQLAFPKEPVFPFRDQVVSMSARDNFDQASSAWFGAYYLALIARAESLLKLLRDPARYYDWMITADLYAPYHQGHYTFLAFLNEPEIAITEFERSARAVAKIPQEWRVLIDIFYPLWLPVLRGDQAGFDKALETAILSHQNYWANPTELEEDNMNDPDGHYSLQLTAIMAYAHDHGLKVNVGSAYTPRQLVEGDVQVDLDTKLDFYF